MSILVVKVILDTVLLSKPISHLHSKPGRKTASCSPAQARRIFWIARATSSSSANTTPLAFHIPAFLTLPLVCNVKSHALHPGGLQAAITPVHSFSTPVFKTNQLLAELDLKLYINCPLQTYPKVAKHFCVCQFANSHGQRRIHLTCLRNSVRCSFPRWSLLPPVSASYSITK